MASGSCYSTVLVFFCYCAQNDTRAGLMFLSLPHHIISMDEIYLRFLISLPIIMTIKPLNHVLLAVLWRLTALESDL